MPMAKTCPHCGYAENPDDAKFCLRCGKPLEAQAPTEAAEAEGFTVSKDEETPGEAPSGAGPQPTPPKKRSKVWLWVLIGVGAALLLFIILCFCMCGLLSSLDEFDY